MPATCWEVLVRTGVESHWSQISVQVPVAYLAILSLWLAWRGNRSTDTTYHTLGMQQWTWVLYSFGNDCKQLTLSHEPSVTGLNCRGWQYNKCNFTLLYFTLLVVITKNKHHEMSHSPVFLQTCIKIMSQIKSTFLQKQTALLAGEQCHQYNPDCLQNEVKDSDLDSIKNIPQQKDHIIFCKALYLISGIWHLASSIWQKVSKGLGPRFLYIHLTTETLYNVQ